VSEDRSLFVARESDLSALQGHWEAACTGSPSVVRLTSPFGGGRRALVSEFLRGVSASADDAVIWRLQCSDQENGTQWLVRGYAALIATLTSDVLRRGKIEMVLNAQLPSQPKRVQNWYQQFISAMKGAKTEGDKVQLSLPQDNPLIGLVEVVAAVARKVPVVLDLQNPYAVNSLLLPLFVECLLAEARTSDAKLLVVMFDEPESDVTRSVHPVPLLDFYRRTEEGVNVQTIEPWSADEVGQYLVSKGIESDAARLAEIAGGRPGFVAELVDILGKEERLGDLDGVTLASLVPTSLDEGELDVPDAPPAEGERKHAGPDDIGRVLHLAALLGQAFPSNLVADMGGFDRESVDDLMDAMTDLFEEVQFSKEMGTWIYRFKWGSWREGVIEHNNTEEGHNLARNVGVFMERYLVPRGYGFMVKTARVYAEHGAPGRAAVLRALALTNDSPDSWGLAYDLTKYFDDIAWPDPMRRTIYQNLVDRLVGAGSAAAAEKVLTEATEFATGLEDRDLTAWLLLAGSRLDARRQDLFRARDRGKDALKMYLALDNKMKAAEVHNHLATIELADGNPNAALDQANQAVELGKVEVDGKEGVVPGVFAAASHVRGLVARRSGKPDEAAEHFRRANDVAGQAGLGQLALDAGLNYGEALLAGGKREQGRDALERVLQIARALRNPARERSACDLLAKAEASLKNFDKALPLAQRALQLTQTLKYDHLLPIDTYHVGFYLFLNKKPAEALSFFKHSADRVGNLGKHPMVRDLYYFKGLAHIQTGELDEGLKTLRDATTHLREAKEWPKLCSALDNISLVENRRGNASESRKALTEAVAIAKSANLKEMRKELKKKLDAMS
jgi:tetratricopeptide (TPR) repeat protein